MYIHILKPAHKMPVGQKQFSEMLIAGIIPKDLIHLHAITLNGLFIQCINRSFSFPSAGDDSSLGQNLHIVSQGGLSDLEALQQHAAAHFPA